MMMLLRNSLSSRWILPAFALFFSACLPSFAQAEEYLSEEDLFEEDLELSLIHI